MFVAECEKRAVSLISTVQTLELVQFGKLNIQP
jgi:hypothetical protein